MSQLCGARAHRCNEFGWMRGNHWFALRRRTPTMPGMSDRISRDDVAHVARLARLALTDTELDRFTGQLAAVLEHARDVEALDVADVEPMMHPYPLVNVLRDDVVTATVDRDEVLAAGPSTEDGRFRVPPILDAAP
jgi:aspartyl-tRNA(Asn)/glutamyl-tRNA(Gln) amidotransferase subunit C